MTAGERIESIVSINRARLSDRARWNALEKMKDRLDKALSEGALPIELPDSIGVIYCRKAVHGGLVKTPH